MVDVVINILVDPKGPLRELRVLLYDSWRLKRELAYNVSNARSGQQRLIAEGLRCVGKASIAVRDTYGIAAKNPLPFFAVKQPRFRPMRPGSSCARSSTCSTGKTSARIVLGGSKETIFATHVRGLSASP